MSYTNNQIDAGTEIPRILIIGGCVPVGKKARRRNINEQYATAIVRGNGFTLKENPELDRIQFIFDEKPDEETRHLLRHSGFLWAPSKGAWQRKLTDNGRAAAKRIAEALGRPEAAEVDGQTSML